MTFYRNLENLFEKLSMAGTRILGNAISFIIALVLVLLYFTDDKVINQPRNRTIMDIIFATTFLSLFIIQKTVNRLSAALHLKMNELVASHDKASNRMINIENKTEEELLELAQHYNSLVEKIKTSSSTETSHTIDNIIEKDLEEETPNQ